MALLEQYYSQAEVKRCRRKRKAFMTKVGLHVDLISAIQSGDVAEKFSDADLQAMQDKISKMEAEEVFERLDKYNAKRARPPKSSRADHVSKVRLNMNVPEMPVDP